MIAEIRDAEGLTEDERAAHEIITVIKNDAKLYATYRRAISGHPPSQLWNMTIAIIEVGRKYENSGWQRFTLPQLVLALNMLAEGLTPMPTPIKTEPKAPRPIHQIAADIRANWPKPYYAAVPYLDAMSTLSRLSDSFGAESADSILRYFLVNAWTWKGTEARRLKSEIKALLRVSPE